jgi:hypothetical protein
MPHLSDHVQTCRLYFYRGESPRHYLRREKPHGKWLTQITCFHMDSSCQETPNGRRPDVLDGAKN